MSENEEKKKEGPRGFAVILQELEDGTLHTELSAQVQKLIASLHDHAKYYQTAGVGKLTLGLTMKCDEKGVVTIVSDVKTVEPKRKRSATTMYATPGNNLSVANPRQTRLPLAEVPRPKMAEEIPAETPAVRSV